MTHGNLGGGAFERLPRCDTTPISDSDENRICLAAHEATVDSPSSLGVVLNECRAVSVFFRFCWIMPACDIVWILWIRHVTPTSKWRRQQNEQSNEILNSKRTFMWKIGIFLKRKNGMVLYGNEKLLWLLLLLLLLRCKCSHNMNVMSRLVQNSQLYKLNHLAHVDCYMLRGQCERRSLSYCITFNFFYFVISTRVDTFIFFTKEIIPLKQLFLKSFSNDKNKENVVNHVSASMKSYKIYSGLGWLRSSHQQLRP